MAIMRKKDIKGLDKETAIEKIKEFRLELSKELASVEVGASIKNPGRIREIKKTIARILTEQNMKKKKEV